MATRILFTGDSITDASRTDQVKAMEEMFTRMGERLKMDERAERTNTALGTGYPLLVAAQLGAEEPGKYEILNRGIAGNRIVDLDARVKVDLINLKPDVLSILVGVNDIAHEPTLHNGVDEVKFERVYDYMLAEILKALPNLKLIMVEPYVLKGKGTEEFWDIFNEGTALRREAVRRLAKKYGAPLLPAQKLFSDAAAATSVTDWTMDGVHPTPAGHWMLAQEWLKIFRTL